MKELIGTGVAMVTPFNADGAVDFLALEKLTNHLVEGGVNYLVVMGTTGESVTLSKKEKEEVLACVLETNGGKHPVVLGVGGNNTSEVVSQLKSLNTRGITALLSVSPAYNKPNQNGIYAHYKAVSEASPLPIILYNVPGRTGSNILAETTLRLAADFDNIIAVKEASGSVDQCTAILKDKPADFMVISGDDTLSLPIIASGGSGVISVVANALPQQYSRLISSSLNGDFNVAQRHQYQLFDLINMLFEEGNPAGVKAVLKALDICEENVRLPLIQVSSELRRRLLSELKTIIN